MHPNIDVVTTEEGPFPSAFIILKHWISQGKRWPKTVQNEQCLSLECLTAEEVEDEVQRLKLELDECVARARRFF